MSTINTSLIKPDADNPRYGLYLNPRETFGWNEQLIQLIEQTPEQPLDSLLEEYQCLNTKEMQENPTVKKLSELLNLEIPIYGIGKNSKQALNNATKKLNNQFKKLMFGQYSNAVAFKWTYLDPQYLKIIKTTISENQIIILTK
jgi:hypothetical protein